MVWCVDCYGCEYLGFEVVVYDGDRKAALPEMKKVQ